PALLLLHGFPTSSHMYRDLIPALADRYHVVAPDLPGFGFTEAPERKHFKYSFEHLADVIERFTEAVGLHRYALYVFDYGAPIGFRLAIRHPEQITAVISQNGNAYLQGLSEGWNPIQAYWKEPTPENRAALRAFLKPEATEWQYRHGVPTPERLSPDTWTLDAALLARSGKCGDPLRFIWQLPEHRRALPQIPGVFPYPAAAATGRMGQERSIFSARRRRGIQEGQSGCRGPFARRGSFRARKPRTRDRGHHPRLPRPQIAETRPVSVTAHFFECERNSTMS